MTRKLAIFLLAAVGLAAAAFSTPRESQQGTPPQLRTEKVADGIYMLVGMGGNIGVATGEDAVFLVDDQYAPATEQIRKAVAEIGKGDVRFILNTHWHDDHTGGNENFGKAGTLIVAHDNVRRRMTSEQFLALFNQKYPPSPKAALPVDPALPVDRSSEDGGFQRGEGLLPPLREKWVREERPGATRSSGLRRPTSCTRETSSSTGCTHSSTPRPTAPSTG